MEIFIITLLFVISVAFSGGAGFLYKSITKKMSTLAQIPLILIVACVPLAIIFFIMALISGFSFSMVSLICGIFAGIAFSIAVGMLILSISKGDYSISVIIINLSFFIPIILSAIFIGDKVSILQISAIILLTICIVILNIDFSFLKRRKEKQAAIVTQKKSNVWIIFAIAACLMNGASTFIIKLQQSLEPKASPNVFYFFMYGAALLFAIILFCCTLKLRAKENKAKPILLLSTLLGICIAGSYYPLSFLASRVNASLQFGVATAGAILLSLLMGWIFLKEKVTLKSIISLVICLCAIVLQVIQL